MSGRSSWCFTGDHLGCTYAACTCDCHRRAATDPRAEDAAPEQAATVLTAAVVAAVPRTAALLVPSRPVPSGTQAELGFPDSIDGSTDDVTTVSFSLHGQAYEVDLSRQHRDDLQAALAPFIAAAHQE